MPSKSWAVLWGRAWVLPSLPSLCLMAAVGSEASHVVCMSLFVLKKSWNPRGSAVLSVIWNPKCAALLQLREFPCLVRSRGGWEGARGCWISGFCAGLHAVGYVDFSPDLFCCWPCTALTPTGCVHTRPSRAQVLNVALRKTQQKSEVLPSAHRARGGQSSQVWGSKRMKSLYGPVHGAALTAGIVWLNCTATPE